MTERHHVRENTKEGERGEEDNSSEIGVTA